MTSRESYAITAGMFSVGQYVEVYRTDLKAWIAGKVMERRARPNATPIYYVQLVGYTSTDPNAQVWFTIEHMRAAP